MGTESETDTESWPAAEPETGGEGRTRSAPELRTERLLLRSLEADDAERLAAIADDRRIARNMSSVFPHPYTRDDAEAFIASGSDGSYAIVPLESITDEHPNGQMVGMVGGAIHQSDDSAVYAFGYWLGVDHWGRGYATEAARACLDVVMAERELRRIEAMVYGWNPASGRVLEKLGFTHEATLARRIYRFGDVTDELVYARLL